MKISTAIILGAIIGITLVLWDYKHRISTLEYCFNTPLNERDEERCR